MGAYPFSADDASTFVRRLLELADIEPPPYYYGGNVIIPSAFDAVASQLIASGVHPSKSELIAYANRKQTAIMTGGTMVSIGGGVSVECSTDAASLVLLQGAATVANASPTTTFNWVPHSGSPITLTAAQITTMFGAVTTFVQATFNTLSAVIAAINAGTVTSTAAVDSFASPAWPTNS